MFIDKHMGRVRAIIDRSEKKDHKILEFVKPLVRELNPSSFTPNDFRLPDTVNNHMYYRYEILCTFYIYAEEDGIEKLVLQVDVILKSLLEDDEKLKMSLFDALDFHVNKELDVGAGLEIMHKKNIGCVIRGLVPL